MIQEIVMRERGVDLHKELSIPDSIQAPYNMAPPTWYKPSLPQVQYPHPLVEYGVKHVEGNPIAWFTAHTFDHRFETDFRIEINGVELWKRKYFFKD
ncbi:hypothetical protein ACK32N_07770 [Aeromonas caviae]